MNEVWVLEYQIIYGYEPTETEVVGVFESAEAAKAALIERVPLEVWKMRGPNGRVYFAPGGNDRAEWDLYKVSFNAWEKPHITAQEDY